VKKQFSNNQSDPLNRKNKGVDNYGKAHEKLYQNFRVEIIAFPDFPELMQLFGISKKYIHNL